MSSQHSVLPLLICSGGFHWTVAGGLFNDGAGLDLFLQLGVEEVFIDGQTLTTVPAAGSATFTGGLLAQETNIGRYSQDGFAVIPELGITLGYNVTCALRLTFGYTFIYWSKLARPGGRIDRDVNTSLLPPAALNGAARPEFTFTTTDYWVQGLNLGFEYRF